MAACRPPIPPLHDGCLFCFFLFRQLRLPYRHGYETTTGPRHRQRRQREKNVGWRAASARILRCVRVDRGCQVNLNDCTPTKCSKCARDWRTGWHEKQREERCSTQHGGIEREPCSARRGGARGGHAHGHAARTSEGLKLAGRIFALASDRPPTHPPLARLAAAEDLSAASKNSTLRGCQVKDSNRAPQKGGTG